MSLGAMMAGGNPANGRQTNDLYPTPPDVTEALLRLNLFPKSSLVWEPCCGNGAMASVIRANGYNVVATDLYDYGTNQYGLDARVSPSLGESIITNPPFDIAEDLIEHLWHDLPTKRMALVLKSTYWHAKNRYKLWQRCTPRAIYPLTWRPDFLGLGRPTMEVMWCYWGPGEGTCYEPLLRP